MYLSEMLVDKQPIVVQKYDQYDVVVKEAEASPRLGRLLPAAEPW